MDKSIECDSDAIIYDLEDAVALENKPLARETLCAFAAEALASGKEIFVRVNDIATEFFRDDIEAAVLAGVKNIILPKADRPAVQRACEYIDSIEQKRRICGVCLIPLIETPSGVLDMRALMEESSRVAAAQLGAEDLTKELGIKRTKAGGEIEYVRTIFAITCSALRIGAIDTPYTDIKDIGGLRRECIKVKDMGMTAKACIHPSHIGVINEIFSPSPKEIEHAADIIAAAKANGGRGAFTYEGRMIDAPIIARAQKVMEKARLFGLA